MELINKTDIMNYAIRNTSPKMPIEQKYVYAFIDSLMNSSSLQEVYENLKSNMQNGDTFIIFNSFNINARNINKEPYRSIVAYSMLKKDIRLFEFISASLFTGKVIEYHGSDLYNDVTKETDESPTKYTDSGIYTDMSEGLIQIGFQNYYCDVPAEDGGGGEYQTLSELDNAIIDFDYIITLTKPARIGILNFYIPYCYLSGNETELYYAGMDSDYPFFSAPFGDKDSMEIINGLTDNELIELYKEVKMYNTKLQTPINISSEREVIKGDNYIMFSYDMRCQSTKSESTGEEFIWSRISITSNSANKTYVQEKAFNPDVQHYEKYIPIMLRIKDNDPEGPCLALTIENGTPTVGAMFYTRETI